MKREFLSAVLGSAALLGTMAAVAGPLGAQSLPSYAEQDETIHGIVSSSNGYDLSVRDERGFIDKVKLHDGTVINPTGLKLASGQTVTVHGHTQGNVFEANEIDTPYHFRYAYAPGPYYYPAYGYWGYRPWYGPGYYHVGIGFGWR